MKDSVELGLLAAGFEDDCHDSYNLAVYNVQFIFQQQTENCQPSKGGGAMSFGVGSRRGGDWRGCR